MNLNDVATIVLLIIAMLLILFFVPQWMMKRAVKAVIKIFRKENALSPANAKTIDEIRLRPKTLFQRFFGRRDYKPDALQLLIRADIVLLTEDGRVYLSEEKLATTNLRDY